MKNFFRIRWLLWEKWLKEMFSSQKSKWCNWSCFCPLGTENYQYPWSLNLYHCGQENNFSHWLFREMSTFKDCIRPILTKKMVDHITGFLQEIQGNLTNWKFSVKIWFCVFWNKKYFQKKSEESRLLDFCNFTIIKDTSSQKVFHVTSNLKNKDATNHFPELVYSSFGKWFLG